MTHDPNQEGEAPVREREVYFYELQCKASQTKDTDENGSSFAGMPAERSRALFRAEFTCTVKLIKVWFSAGCQNFVHLKAMFKGRQILPSPNKTFDSGGVIGDDLERPFFINKKLRSGDEIQFLYQNSDTNAHTVGLTIEVEPVVQKQTRVPRVVVREPEVEMRPEEEPSAPMDEAQRAYEKELAKARAVEKMMDPNQLLDGVEYE